MSYVAKLSVCSAIPYIPNDTGIIGYTYIDGKRHVTDFKASIFSKYFSGPLVYFDLLIGSTSGEIMTFHDNVKTILKKIQVCTLLFGAEDVKIFFFLITNSSFLC